MALSEGLAFPEATAQDELARKGELTATELVEAAIQRVERLNPALNAVVTPMFDEARAVVKGPLPDGPFRGAPFLLKDILAACEGARRGSCPHRP